MVLSAEDMGIKDGLNPIFCCGCGCRIGWIEDEFEQDEYLYCESCAKKKVVLHGRE